MTCLRCGREGALRRIGFRDRIVAGTCAAGGGKAAEVETIHEHRLDLRPQTTLAQAGRDFRGLPS